MSKYAKPSDVFLDLDVCQQAYYIDKDGQSHYPFVEGHTVACCAVGAIHMCVYTHAEREELMEILATSIKKPYPVLGKKLNIYSYSDEKLTTKEKMREAFLACGL